MNTQVVVHSSEKKGIAPFFEYFKRNPRKLLKYIESGCSSRADGRYLSVRAEHIVQLAEFARIPLEFEGKQYRAIKDSFTIPTRFDNIKRIIAAAREMVLATQDNNSFLVNF